MLLKQRLLLRMKRNMSFAKKAALGLLFGLILYAGYSLTPPVQPVTNTWVDDALLDSNKDVVNIYHPRANSRHYALVLMHMMLSRATAVFLLNDWKANEFFNWAELEKHYPIIRDYQSSGDYINTSSLKAVLKKFPSKILNYFCCNLTFAIVKLTNSPAQLSEFKKSILMLYRSAWRLSFFDDGLPLPSSLRYLSSQYTPESYAAERRRYEMARAGEYVDPNTISPESAFLASSFGNYMTHTEMINLAENMGDEVPQRSLDFAATYRALNRSDQVHLLDFFRVDRKDIQKSYQTKKKNLLVLGTYAWINPVEVPTLLRAVKRAFQNEYTIIYKDHPRAMQVPDIDEINREEPDPDRKIITLDKLVPIELYALEGLKIDALLVFNVSSALGEFPDTARRIALVTKEQTASPDYDFLRKNRFMTETLVYEEFLKDD